MDMEWAKDGQSGELYIVQARPETVISQKNKNVLETYVLKQKGTIVIKGKSVGSKIGAGEANVIKNVHDINQFKKGQVLVTDMTDPDWEPIMKIASAIVTNRGGRTCHAAIISRELGIPCVVGSVEATEKIKNGDMITVSCAEGDEGFVYEGALNFEIQKVDLQNMPRTKTKIMMNCGNPEEVFELSFIPNDGVGLAREEFIVTSYIKAHPLALLNYKDLTPTEKKQIDEISVGYEDKVEFFINRLAQGVAMIAAAFYPKDVILRFSDFKTNEYAGLVGGSRYEPKEDNPMIGWRGASRYYMPGYKDGFALECKAMLKVRNEYGLTNLKLMIPFCRTVKEGKQVLAEMDKNGLRRGENGLEVYVMCEIPANVILSDQFAEIFDGFSIGSNDLTQLTLGLDRDSEIVAPIYDERNDAVKRLIKKVIADCKTYHRKIGICGQAPSDYPEFAQFLVECGIDSISLNPDTVIKTTLKIKEQEDKLGIQ
jgi:pyruvate,water dikinase